MKYRITYEWAGVTHTMTVDKSLLDFTANNRVTYGPYTLTAACPVTQQNVEFWDKSGEKKL